jgi:hypothetical protein
MAHQIKQKPPLLTSTYGEEVKMERKTKAYFFSEEKGWHCHPIFFVEE